MACREEEGRGDDGAVTEQGHSQLERNAYHEAGHAVVAHALGRRFTGVTIIPGVDAMGRCRYAEARNFDPDLPDMYSGPRIERVVEHQIMGYLAGPIAEGILTGEKSWRKTGGNGDVPRAVDLAVYMKGTIEETEAYLDGLWVQTEELVGRRESWAAIEALAAELVEQREVGEGRAREIIDEQRR